MTHRLMRAAANPHVNVIGHPTGRLIGRRDPYNVELEAVMDACKRHNTLLELNAHPDRLDLAARYCRLAKQKGIKLVLSTDAHHHTDLEMMHFGVGTARRGWLEPVDIVNTLAWAQFQDYL
jgi:DNA polymerase (family 10)